jgi:N-formylglutamate amidohydrolase
MRIHQVVVTLCLLLTGLESRLASAQQQLAQAKTASLVTIESGDLPIILSAPHGGRDAIPNVPERLGEGVDRFNPRSDSNTDILTERLAEAIEKKLGKRPYVVIARFHREYADANRRSRDAYESDDAKVVYESYHQAIAQARSQVIERWGRGILFDIHGQAVEPKAILRGTQNGKTTTHLVSRFGREALIGESSLFGQLASQGFSVIPTVGSEDRERVGYDGGYTVIAHGSGPGGTLDAIQLELGNELRSNEALPTTASKLTDAIADFTKQYLSTVEQRAPVAGNTLSAEQVRVGVYCDIGAGPSHKDLLNALAKFEDVSVRKLMADDIRNGALGNVDVLIQPGGSGGGQGRHLGENGREMIRSFILEGGGFIGICGGAYLASADYSWSLNVLDARVVDRSHWARGKGTVQIELTDAGRRVLKSKEQQLAIFYAQGPLLAPRNHPDIADYETLATFKTEIAENGAPEGVMKETTAIARGEFGRGRVFCFSPHPEMTEGLEPLVYDAIDFVRRKQSPQSESRDDSQKP